MMSTISNVAHDYSSGIEFSAQVKNNRWPAIIYPFPSKISFNYHLYVLYVYNYKRKQA